MNGNQDGPGVYRVQLDGKWQLQDMHEFALAFEQCYAFVYCTDPDTHPRRREQIIEAFHDYPWQGGFSYVNAFQLMLHQAPPEDRPAIKSISYASPGVLDLLLSLPIADQIAYTISTVTTGVLAVESAYRHAQKFRRSVRADREKARLEEMRMQRAQIEEERRLCDALAKQMGYKNLQHLHEMTGDPWVSLGLMEAYYVRSEPLRRLVGEGKLSLPVPGQPSDE